MAQKEDECLKQVIDLFQKNRALDIKWEKVSALMRTRGFVKRAKQCRERWLQHLSPGITTGEWSDRDKEFLLDLQTRYGSQWKIIAEFFPGRTDNQVKNQFFSIMRKVLRKACKFLDLGVKSTGVGLIRPRIMAEVGNHPIPNIPPGSQPESVKDFLCYHFMELNDQPFFRTREVNKELLLSCLEYVKSLKWVY